LAHLAPGQESASCPRGVPDKHRLGCRRIRCGPVSRVPSGGCTAQ
jgi:hypothetical protein